jgi:hypothetical protein
MNIRPDQLGNPNQLKESCIELYFFNDELETGHANHNTALSN